MRKGAFLTYLAILTILPVMLSANNLLNMPGPDKDINGIYKNDKFELKIENYNQQSNTFSFKLNSIKGSSCNLAIEGTATRLKLSYSSPDLIRYEYAASDGCKYYFTVFSGAIPSVDVMRYGCKADAANACLPDQASSKLSFDTKQ